MQNFRIFFAARSRDRRAAARRARAAGPALPALPRVSDSILFLTRVSFRNLEEFLLET